MNLRRRFLLDLAVVVVIARAAFANGGAWQTGVPLTGNAAAAEQEHATNVTIEEERLTIDLHQEFGAIEVRYRMRNTGPAVEQDFFFPVERWSPSEDAEKPADLRGYRITADGAELKWENVKAQQRGAKPKAERDDNWGDFPPATKLWKKSRIPFAAGQTRELAIRYECPYAANESSVSDDSRASDAVLAYSLSPAATWKGPIAKGRIMINVLHPKYEEVRIAKPKDRFKKLDARHYEWVFENLKPTLDDDLRIIAHPASQSYPAGGYTDEEKTFRAEYVIEGDRYFLQHTDYDATASSTLNAKGERNYEVRNVKGLETDKTWCEGADGDGIGESITLENHRPLPLDSILIVPGYRNEDASLWTKNNRVAALEITLNGEHTFTAEIPEEKFNGSYPIPVRGYEKPVKTVKLTITGVHRGTAARDTCISLVELKSRLAAKPQIQPAR